MNIWNSYTITG